MNIDAEDLVCFVYQQVNKLTTSLTVNNFEKDVIEEVSNVMPDLLIKFLLEDQELYRVRRTALDMQTNILCANLDFVRFLWVNATNMPTEEKKEKVNEALRSLRLSAIKKAVHNHEKKMQESLTVVFDHATEPSKSKMKM